MRTESVVDLLLCRKERKGKRRKIMSEALGFVHVQDVINLVLVCVVPADLWDIVVGHVRWKIGRDTKEQIVKDTCAR